MLRRAWWLASWLLLSAAALWVAFKRPAWSGLADRVPLEPLVPMAKESSPRAEVPLRPLLERRREPPGNKAPGAPDYFVPLRGKDTYDLVKVFDFNMQYPPGSRPAFKNNQYQMNPDFRTQAGPLRVASDEGESDPVYSYQLTVHDQNVGPGETFVADLTVLRDRTPVRFDISDMTVVNDTVAPPKRLVAPIAGMLAREEPGASEFAYRIRWHAVGTGREYWGSLFLAVKLHVGGKEYVVTQAIESTPMRFAWFTKNFGERLADGSLFIDVEVESERESWCEISGRLYDGDEPTHVAAWTGPIKPGKVVVPLEFFGKIFHDMNFVEGRLELRQLRGKCHNLGFPVDLLTRAPNGEEDLARLAADREAAMRLREGEPDEPSLLEMEALPLAYTTQSYRISDFSNAVWDSPAKREKRALLARVQASRNEIAAASAGQP
jgi:hypothetical protein